MLKETIRICHPRGDTHWLTPDPAWSPYSFGQSLCIREQKAGVTARGPVGDVAVRLLHKFGHRGSTAARRPGHFVPLGRLQERAPQVAGRVDDWVSR